MTTKAVRATIKIAGIGLEVFRLPSGEYVMSQSQVANAVGVDSSNILRFLNKKQVEVLTPNGSKFCTLAIEGGRKPIKVIPTKEASAFWFDQAMKSNSKAQLLSFACMEETLHRRCDNIFSVSKTEQQYEQQSADWLEKWQQTRQYLSEMHNHFTRACHDYGFPPAKTHDKLTLAVCGMKASELRKIELVCGDREVGLNHIDDALILKRVARVKYHFSRYRKGTLEERIERALKEARKEEKTLKVTSNN